MGDKYQKIVSTGFLINKGKVLAVKRSEKETFLPGYFELPGGKIDFGETSEEALEREFREEVGIEINVGKPFRTFSYVSSDGDRHTIEIVYLVTTTKENPEITLSEAHTESQWIEEDKIQDYHFSEETRQSVMEGFKVAMKNLEIQEGMEWKMK